LVTVNSGSIASTNSPQTINCIGDVATVSATPGANTTCVWYAAATGGSPLFTGNSYAVTPASLPTTYYVEPVTTLFTNHYNEGGQKVIANTFGSASTFTTIVTTFTTSASIRIDSIKVLPGATGTLTVALQNGGSATNILTFNQTITAAQVGSFINVPVNFAIAGSGNYQLLPELRVLIIVLILARMLLLTCHWVEYSVLQGRLWHQLIHLLHHIMVQHLTGQLLPLVQQETEQEFLLW
jgi:hypothetical protein